MNLKKVYGPAWVASGACGFFGEGYWFHAPFKFLFGLTFKRTVFVGKTTTTFANKGFMELTAKYEPKRFFPDCIAFYPSRGIMLNSVGLSGPGFEALLATGRWQKIREPFMLSWMPVGKTIEEQVQEATEFVRLLKAALPGFLTSQLGLQFNVSCPNVGADLTTIFEKAMVLLEILKELEIPIVVKLNLLMRPETAVLIAQHPAVAGLCVANTTPFGELFDETMWQTHFPDGSPLAKRNYGSGGLSGKLNYAKGLEWVRQFRKLDKKTYLNYCGGIDRKEKINDLSIAGANSISFATVIPLRPWRVSGIIKQIHDVFW